MLLYDSAYVLPHDKRNAIIGSNPGENIVHVGHAPLLKPSLLLIVSGLAGMYCQQSISGISCGQHCTFVALSQKGTST